MAMQMGRPMAMGWRTELASSVSYSLVQCNNRCLTWASISVGRLPSPTPSYVFELLMKLSASWLLLK